MNKTSKLKLGLIFLTLLLVFSLLPANGFAETGDELKLTVLHINDVHGRTQAEPYISQMVLDLIARGENVLVLDAGDRLHGQTATNLTKGETMVEIMNTVGYSAMAPGNHDFNFGIDRLTELSESMNFPLLAANVKDAGGDYLFERKRIFELGGLTVGVFGITTPETAVKTDPKIAAGLTFENPVETAKIMVKELKAEGCDIIIALAHLGDGKLTAEDERSDALTAVSGIDVVIDGHSHTRIDNGKIVGEALIAQAGEYAKYIGIVEATSQKGKMLKTARLAVVPEPDGETELPCNETVSAKIAEEELKTADVTSVIVGYTPVALEGEREAVRTRETNLANLITDSMLYVTGADISFLTGGNIRSGIDAGDITMGHVLTTLPFSNLIVTLEMKGSDILEALEHGVAGYPEPVGEHIQVGGLRFEFDPEAPPMGRVTDARLINGGGLQPDEVYTVATIEFIAAGGDGYAMVQNGANMVWYQGDAEAFVRYLETAPSIVAAPESRVTATGTQPEPATKAYIVKPGDYLIKIARLFDITWQELQILNGIINPNLIYPGQVIILP